MSNETLNKNLLEKYSRVFGIEKPLFHFVSCNTGEGIDSLAKSLVSEFQNVTTSDPIIVSTRTRDLLVNDVLHGFKEFQDWRGQEDVVLASESLRQSVEGIGKITGDAVGVEEILGIVFSSFCIGK